VAFPRNDGAQALRSGDSARGSNSCGPQTIRHISVTNAHQRTTNGIQIGAAFVKSLQANIERVYNVRLLLHSNLRRSA
jgi:hypothetical protein